MSSNDGKISLSDVYSTLWKCRDLEISMLWTRLTLLGAFMALTYAGYGSLIFKGLDGVRNWSHFNLVAVGASSFGFLFSLLWTVTAKGSKAWFERYEAMLGYVQEIYKANGVFNAHDAETLILSYLDYAKPCILQRVRPVDSNILSQLAGAYSVSKIPIVMGQVSMIAWGCLGLGHSIACTLGRSSMLALFSWRGASSLSLFIVVMTAIVAVVICACVESSALKRK